jgi:hypothetical protein
VLCSFKDLVTPRMPKVHCECSYLSGYFDHDSEVLLSPFHSMLPIEFRNPIIDQCPLGGHVSNHHRLVRCHSAGEDLMIFCDMGFYAIAKARDTVSEECSALRAKSCFDELFL